MMDYMTAFNMALSMHFAPEDEIEMDIGSYEIVDFGIQSSDEFLGIGSNEDYEAACYGIGDTYSEALDDALEMMIQADEDTRQLMMHIEKQEFIPGIDDLRPRVDHDQCCFHEDTDSCELFYHVGIRWNL